MSTFATSHLGHRRIARRSVAGRRRTARRADPLCQTLVGHEDGRVGSSGGPRADRPKRRSFTAAYKLEGLDGTAVMIESIVWSESALGQ